MSKRKGGRRPYPRPKLAGLLALAGILGCRPAPVELYGCEDKPDLGAIAPGGILFDAAVCDDGVVILRPSPRAPFVAPGSGA